MFYQKQAIEKHLICKVCNKLFDDPRVLPCSHTYCQFCIVSTTSKEENSIDCPECHTKHQVPPNGFPINSIVVNLLQEQANQVSQWSKVKQLRQTLDSIDSRCKVLEKSIQVGSDEIKDYCMSLRQKIDLATETRIEEIRKLNEEFKKQVDDYEKECLTSYDATSERVVLEEVKPFLAEMNKFYVETNQALSGFEIEDKQVDELTKASVKQLAQIEAKENLLKSKKFNYELVILSSPQLKLDRLCLGVAKKKIRIIETNTLRELNIKASSDSTISQVSCSTSNQLINVAYRVNPYTIKLAHYDIDGSNAKYGPEIKLRNADYNKDFEILSIFNSLTDTILVLGITYPSEKSESFLTISSHQYTLSPNTRVFFIKVSKDFTYLSHLCVNHDSEIQTMNSYNIFCFDRANKKVWVYSTFLSASSHFDQNIPAQAQDMHSTADSLFISHTHNGTMQVRVFCIKTKTVAREISLPSLNFTQLKPLSPNLLLAFNNQDNRFALVHSDNSSWEEFDLPVDVSFEKNLRLARDCSPHLILFNSQEIKCSFSFKNLC